NVTVKTFKVKVNDLVVAPISGQGNICMGSTSVYTTASSLTGGVWSTSNPAIATISQSGLVTPVSAGSVTILFTNNCGNTASINVSVNITPTTPLVTVVDNCGSSILSTTGSSLLWSNGSTNSSITVTTPGVYTVTCTKSGCTSLPGSGTAAPKVLPATPVITVVNNCGSVTLSTNATGALLWSTGETTSSIVVTDNHTYSVTQTVNGCTSLAASASGTPYATPSKPSLSVADNCGYSILTATGTGSILWSTGETTPSITVTGSGSYWVEVTVDNGCVGTSDTVTVEVYELPTPVITTDGPPSFCVGDTVFLTSTVAENYLWSTGDTTQSIFVLTSGNYTVTVTDTNGCSGTSNPAIVDINANPNPTITPGGTISLCEGDTIDLVSAAAASYLWNTGDTTQILSVSVAGVYNVFATDSSGCSGTSADVIVLVTPLPTPTIIVDGDLDFCLGGTVGLSTQTYAEYQWSTGAISQGITVNASGSYIVTVTDANGCVGVSPDVDITVYEPPVVTVTTTGPTQFCEGDSVVLTSSPGVSYAWSTGATTQSITVFTSGSFNVLVTDQNGCVGESPLVTIQVFPTPNADIIVNGATEFCEGDSAILTAIGGQTYVWSTGETTNSIVVYDEGSYYVVASSQFGCVDTSSTVTINVNNPPTVVVFPDGPTEFCDGGSVTLVVSGADNYVWSTGAIGTSITVTTSGFYSVEGTNANGCTTETADIEVTVYPLPDPVVTANGPIQFCDGDSVVLTSSDAASYLWSTNETTQSITVFTTGSYIVTVTDTNTCEATSSPINVEVFENPVPIITLSGPDTFCVGDSVVLTSSAADSYAWSTGDTTQSITVYSTGNYAVDVVDANGCGGVSDSVAITVFENPVPEITANGDTVLCEGESLLLIASDADSYLWSTTAQTQSITVTVTGMYTVTVTDGNGCMGSDSIEVRVNPLPNPPPVITANGPTTFCQGDSVNLEVDTWETYLWSPGGDTTQSIWVDASDLYVVTVTNEFGCEADAAGVVVTVNENPEPVIQASGNGGICAGDSIILATGDYAEYLWSPTGDTTQFVSVDSTGTYSVTVTNSFGCVGTSEDFEVTQNPLPEVFIDADNPTLICEGDEFTLTAVGNGPYLWSNGDTTQSITVSIGTYFVQVTDTVTGCTATSDDIVLESYPEFVPVIEADGPTAFCEGEEVTLTVVEGESFLWSTQDTTQSITVSESGVYTVTVTDSNGCTGTNDQTVTVIPTPPTQIIPDFDAPYCEGDVVTLTATGIPFLSDFDWTPNGETTQIIEVTENGIYSVTVTYPSGCSSEATMPVFFIPAPDAHIDINGNTSLCEGDSVTLTASGFPFINSWLWSNGETSQSITVTVAGTYSVTVIGQLCSATSDPVVIEVVPGSVADAGKDETICIGDEVVLTVSEGENYLWSTGETTQSITVSPDQSTTYTVQVTNNGCDQIATDEVDVSVEEYPTAAFVHGLTNLGKPVEFTDSSTVQPLFSWEP
ncbi:MAG: Ig-like domain-containing protein, partial [Flavobacteriales bacterium]|nr:Ig-like domain-containing protein [Flavobacteriales bacterium]